MFQSSIIGGLHLKLKELVEQLTIFSVQGTMDVDITGINMNSREVKQGDLFVCISGIPGLQEDRHQYIDHAIEAGAVALIVERDIIANVPTIKVPNARFALALLSTHFYGYPSHDLKLIGVTGTNGKTTTSHMIESILAHASYRTGLMGNIGTKIGSTVYKSKINTQDPHMLQSNLAKMKECSTDYCVMEVTSQGLHMGRVVGCEFRTAVFTNLTGDHLDYHGTMDNYLMAKGTLFSRMGNSYSHEPSKQKFAILNADDPASKVFNSLTTAQVVTYGINNPADVMAEDIQFTAKGTTSFKLVSFGGTVTIQCKMVGAFNVYNALAAIATVLTEQIPLHSIQQALSEFTNVSGRMQMIDGDQDFLVIADYAHTTDAINNALLTLREIAHKRLITVMCCEGENESELLSQMRASAVNHSDIVIVHAEPSSMEGTNRIIKDLEMGQGKCTSLELMPNPIQAIARAIELARPEDIVLITGKEDYKTDIQHILKDYQSHSYTEVGDHNQGIHIRT